MAIQISSGGVSKTYRYYPYDAFYVSANGSINASGDGEQVKEAYFNGVKYYPEPTDLTHCYRGTLTSQTRQTSSGFSVSLTHRWEWHVNGTKYIPRYFRPSSYYPTTVKPTEQGWNSNLSWYRTYRWDSQDAAHEDPLLEVLNDAFEVTVDFGQYSWIRDYLTAESQADYDTLTNGLTISGSRFFQFVPSAYQTTYHENDIATMENDIVLAAASGAMDSSSSGRYGCTLYSSSLRVILYIDETKCGEGTNITRIYGTPQVVVHPTQITYSGFSIARGIPSPYESVGADMQEESYFEPVTIAHPS